ncbi:MAG TPA: hypothetical protein VIE65_02155 [Methylobacter sp.]
MGIQHLEGNCAPASFENFDLVKLVGASNTPECTKRSIAIFQGSAAVGTDITVATTPKVGLAFQTPEFTSPTGIRLGKCSNCDRSMIMLPLGQGKGFEFFLATIGTLSASAECKCVECRSMAQSIGRETNSAEFEWEEEMSVNSAFESPSFLISEEEVQAEAFEYEQIQLEGEKNAEDSLLKQILDNGLQFQADIAGKIRDIKLSPQVARTLYIPKQHPESQEYRALSGGERAKVAEIVNRNFKKATRIDRKLDPKNPSDKPWIRIWLTLRDIVMRVRSEVTAPKVSVWPTDPLPPSEYYRFEAALKDLEIKARATQDPRKWRYLCWIEKLKKADTDDRIIGWSKICPYISGAIGAAFIVGPCDLTQGKPVDQTALERSIHSVSDVEIANKSLQFISHMRSAIVVSFEMTALPLENLRSDTDNAGLAIEKLDKWANNPMGGSSAMPPAYRAIKDWIMNRQNDTKSLYSCL